MRRPVETATEVPILQIVYNAGGVQPITLTVPVEWTKTGEVCLSRYHVADLVEFNLVLQHAQYYLADLVFDHLIEDETRRRLENKEPPF